MMLNEGCQVAMVEMLDAVGTGMFSVIINDIMSRIKPKDPTMYLHTMLTEIGDGYVMVKDVKTGEEKRIEADHVVLSLGVAPRADVLAEYRSAFKNVICVGDNAQPGPYPPRHQRGLHQVPGVFEGLIQKPRILPKHEQLPTKTIFRRM